MKKYVSKFVSKIFVLGLFISLLAPTSIFAQQYASTRKINKRVKVEKHHQKVQHHAQQRSVVHYKMGSTVAFLPRGTAHVVIRHQSFYRKGTVFFLPLNNGRFQVIPPPMGAKVKNLPEGARRFDIDGRKYYRHHKIYYKPVKRESGKRSFKVVRVG